MPIKRLIAQRAPTIVELGLHLSANKGKEFSVCDVINSVEFNSWVRNTEAVEQCEFVSIVKSDGVLCVVFRQD